MRQTRKSRLPLALMLGTTAAFAAAMPALAQFFPFDDRYPFQQRRFDQPQEERPVDYSRAPAPKKAEIPPSIKILVLGDSMADWLSYGLEDALSETPEIGMVRKHRTFSGLVRYDTRSNTQWPQVAKDLITQEKPQAIVMMLGLQDRHAIRDSGQVAARPGAQDDARKPDQDAEQAPQIAAPELQRSRVAGQYEYRSEKWRELYEKRIDETIAVMKAANVPVMWVGLPSIRGARSTSDMSYLNELYRARADKAGIIFVDVWDGFVDERGNFVLQGPDYEGQIRRLRTGDGVHFTKFGARKLAHYVERELRRVLTQPVPVALTTPSEPAPQKETAAPAKPSGPAARPLAGPVILLASPPNEPEELLGAKQVAPSIDAVASRVLVRGDTLPSAAGRADDFAWPPRAPNTELAEPLPPTGSPLLAMRPPAQKAVQGAGPVPPGGARVAGQQVLQGQIQPQGRQAPPPFWRQQAPPSYGPSRGFFGLFGGRW